MPTLTVIHGCRTLQLSKGQNTLIDEGDWEAVSRFKWHYRGSLHNSNGYATRNVRGDRPSSQKPIRLHRVLMEVNENQRVDHRNGDPLDNRRSNLRIASHQENCHNIHRTRGMSRYKGVWWWPQKQRWRAHIRLNGQHRYIGLYRTEEEAARAYDNAARKHFGEFAWTNAHMYGDY